MGRSSSLLSVSEASVMVRWHTPNLCQPRLLPKETN
jgi:hypothetical protein